MIDNGDIEFAIEFSEDTDEDLDTLEDVVISILVQGYYRALSDALVQIQTSLSTYEKEDNPVTKEQVLKALANIPKGTDSDLAFGKKVIQDYIKNLESKDGN